MFKNYSDCEKCAHTKVCQYKIQLKEVDNKIKDRWNNVCAPDIFKLELSCNQYIEKSTNIKQMY